MIVGLLHSLVQFLLSHIRWIGVFPICCGLQTIGSHPWWNIPLWLWHRWILLFQFGIVLLSDVCFPADPYRQNNSKFLHKPVSGSLWVQDNNLRMVSFWAFMASAVTMHFRQSSPFITACISGTSFVFSLILVLERQTPHSVDITLNSFRLHKSSGSFACFFAVCRVSFPSAAMTSRT